MKFPDTNRLAPRAETRNKDCGVEVCFANPGTSEMQLVAAVDRTHGMRAILGLFEGVVTDPIPVNVSI